MRRPRIPRILLIKKPFTKSRKKLQKFFANVGGSWYVYSMDKITEAEMDAVYEALQEDWTEADLENFYHQMNP